MAQSITRLESEIYVTLEIACRLLSCCVENIFNMLNRIKRREKSGFYDRKTRENFSKMPRFRKLTEGFPRRWMPYFLPWHSEDFFASVASRVLSSIQRIRWYQFCGPALSCGPPNFSSLRVNEVDVVVVVLKLSGESVLLSGMDMEVFKRGKNSRKRFTI